jgi:hypothetical protein
MDMPFGYPRISIPGLTHHRGGQDKDSKVDLETKKEGSNPYSTRTLVKPSMVAYIKPGRDAPREISQTTYNIIDTQY